MEEAVIQKAIQYIKEYFADDYSGHDYWHSFRVYKLAEEIARKEQANLFIVRLAALLHDVDDRKISPDTYERKENAVSFMKQCGIDDRIISDVCTIIEDVSYEGNSVTPQSLEGKCVQDADRIDAIGAIGIARAFSYGGNHNRAIYDPEIEPSLNMTRDEYRKHISTTINHFYEKLFRLKELLNTSTAKEIAEHRDRYMHEYVDEFLLEWEGKR